MPSGSQISGSLSIISLFWLINSQKGYSDEPYLITVGNSSKEKRYIALKAIAIPILPINDNDKAENIPVPRTKKNTDCCVSKCYVFQ